MAVGPGRKRTAVAALGVLLLVAMAFAVGVGPTPIGPGVLWGALLHPTPSTVGVIVWQIRVPRVLGGALVGAALAMSGLVFQALLRNPLADPYLIGTSSGASLGAALALLLLPGTLAVPGGAFVGAVAAVLAATGVARRPFGTSVATMVLLGYALSIILGALTALLLFIHSQELQPIFFWELGGLSSMAWPQVWELAAAVVVGLLAILSGHRHLDAFSLGEAEAHGLGVDVVRSRWLFILAAGLLTAFSVYAAGLIGFVGLVAPHVARRLVGGVHRFALPVAAMGGGAFLVLADALARAFPAYGEIPVGIVTALLGGPFFIALLLRTGVRRAGP